MIERIQIQNYKSIQNADIKLGNLNVLIGTNGAGKSNLISFFELVQEMLNQRLGSYVLKRDGMERLLYNGLKHSEYIKGLIDFDNKNAFFFKLIPTLANKAFIEYSGDYFNNKGTTEKKYKDAWNKDLWDNSVEESGIIDSPKWRAGYLKNHLSSFTVYHFHDTSLTSSMRYPCNIDDNAYLRHDASNLAAFLYRLQVNEPKNFKLLEATIRSVAPYFNRFNLRPDALPNNQIKIEWLEKDNDGYRDAFSFSDGTIRFIALATLLIQDNPPATVIIDEPELGLHPRAINKLAGLIRRASTQSQIILATQSVELLNNFDADDVIVVDRKDNQTTFERLDKEHLSVWLDDYALGEIWTMNLIKG